MDASGMSWIARGTRSFSVVRSEMEQRPIILVSEMDKLLSDFLFEIKPGIKSLQRGDRLLEHLDPLGFFSGRIFNDLSVLLSDCVTQLLDLFAQPRKHLHVALTALDFLV